MRMIFLQASGQSQLMSFLPLILIVFIMVFMFILPQRKIKKEQEAFLSNIKKGDWVATNGGIIGKINKIEDGVITLETGGKSYISVSKAALSKQMSDTLKSKSETA